MTLLLKQPSLQDAVAHGVLKALVIYFNRLQLLVANRLGTALPGCAQATTTTKAKTVTTTPFFIEGLAKSKAGTDNFWTLGAAGANTLVAAGMFQTYLLLVDAAGAATVLEGTQAATQAAVILPNIPQAKCIFGYVTVGTVAVTFTPGTDVLATGSGLTVTFTDGPPSGYTPLIADPSNNIVFA